MTAKPKLEIWPEETDHHMPIYWTRDMKTGAPQLRIDAETPHYTESQLRWKYVDGFTGGFSGGGMAMFALLLFLGWRKA